MSLTDYNTSSRSVTDLDRAAGRNLRLWRTELNISQQALAERVGVRFQMIQKYEAGTARMTLTRALQIASALNISISDILAGIEPGSDASMLPQRKRCPDFDVAFSSITDKRKKRAIIDLVQAVASFAA